MRANLQPIRILIIDDHTILRRGLRMMLDQQSDLQVVGEAGTGTAARQELLTRAPDLVLTDLFLPDLDDVEICDQVHALSPTSKLLILSGTQSGPTIQRAVATGIDGFLLKEVTPAELAEAIRQVMRGVPVFHPEVTAMLRTHREKATTHPNHPTSRSDLTTREHQVLSLMATTASNREIAEQLALGEETVRTHVKNILRKLHAKNRTQAVIEALRHNLICLN
ncbi:MAG: response regulator transcription factor [Caldilineaceae bacterium]|nr:response regulator transcription factor [Caldilineaceae bacterium]